MHPNTRRSIRLKGYDYAQQGAYYITICTDERRQWFGQIEGGVMHRSPIGELAQRCWDEIPDHMPHVDIGEFIVMPNHVHGIVIIRERMAGTECIDGTAAISMPVPRHPEMSVDHDPLEMPVDHDRPLRDPKRAMPVVPIGSLGRIIRAFKSAVTRIAYRNALVTQGTAMWQRNYWDRVIRDAAEYARIADYIRDNPAKWERDRFNRR